MPTPIAVREIKDVEDVKLWIAEHDGRINAYWDQQRQFNAEVQDDMRNVFSRLNAVERRAAWMAGVGAGAGALLGTLLAFLTGLGGG